MRNGNDDFSTSSIEQPNGSSQKHPSRTQLSIFTVSSNVFRPLADFVRREMRISQKSKCSHAVSHFANNLKTDASEVAYMQYGPKMNGSVRKRGDAAVCYRTILREWHSRTSSP